MAKKFKTSPEFLTFMDSHDHNELPDGAWFAMLEQAGEEWLKRHPYISRWYDGNDLAHAYLKHLKGECDCK